MFVVILTVTNFSSFVKCFLVFCDFRLGCDISIAKLFLVTLMKIIFYFKYCYQNYSKKQLGFLTYNLYIYI